MGAWVGVVCEGVGVEGAGAGRGFTPRVSHWPWGSTVVVHLWTFVPSRCAFRQHLPVVLFGNSTSSSGLLAVQAEAASRRLLRLPQLLRILLLLWLVYQSCEWGGALQPALSSTCRQFLLFSGWPASSRAAFSRVSAPT